MLHKITLFSRSAVLNLVYLDQSDNLLAFTQNAAGIWANAPVPGPIPQQVTFKALLGLVNILFAMDQQGKLWSISQDLNGNWDPNGFQALTNQAGLGFIDFGITSFNGIDIVVVGLTGGGFIYTQFGPLQGPLTEPALLSRFEGGGANTSMAVAAIPSTPQDGGTPTAVLLVTRTFGEEMIFLIGAYSTDGVNWQAATVPQEVINITNIVTIGSGNNGTLQAIGLNSTNITGNISFPTLLWDSSGNGSNWASYGLLPNPNSISFSLLAAGNGNGGNLQVVGIGSADGMPYLIWQDNSTGNWSPYNNPNGSGMKLPYTGPQIIDLAMAVGGPGSQGFLQVGCIGSDGNIYVNYQDLVGTWRSYGPLP